MSMPYGAAGCRCWHWDLFDGDDPTNEWGWEDNPDCPLHGEAAERWENEGGKVLPHTAQNDCPTWGPVAVPGTDLDSYECRCAQPVTPSPHTRWERVKRVGCRRCESDWINGFHPSGRAIAAQSISKGEVTIECEGHDDDDHACADEGCTGEPTPPDDAAPVPLSPGAVACTWYGCRWEASGAPESALMKVLLDHVVREHGTTEKRTGVFSACAGRVRGWLGALFTASPW